MRRKWKERLSNGTKPSFLLREALRQNPGLSSLDLDTIFEEEFPDLPQEITVINFLWEWNKSGSEANCGINDEQLDELIMKRLFETPH